MEKTAVRPSAPCKDCKDRELGCHDWCQLYREFRKELDQYNEVVKKNKEKERW